MSMSMYIHVVHKGGNVVSDHRQPGSRHLLAMIIRWQLSSDDCSFPLQCPLGSLSWLDPSRGWIPLVAQTFCTDDCRGLLEVSITQAAASDPTFAGQNPS